jgi:hypothetical protein
LAALFTFFPASAADWYVVDEWEIPSVPEDLSFGLEWRDNLIYIVNWDYDFEGPYSTNLYVHDESGNYIGLQYPDDLTDINCAGLDWKYDTDHGGKGWYLGSEQGNTVYFVEENGGFYSSFNGHSTFGRVTGVAHNPDDDMLYISDSGSTRIAWGTIDGSGRCTSWHMEHLPLTRYEALEYVRNSRGTDYLFGLYIAFGDPLSSRELHIWELAVDGVPVDIFNPDDIADFGDAFYYACDIGWDGDNLWLSHYDTDGRIVYDVVSKIDLPDYSSEYTVIKPMSFGRVKIQFR